MKIIKIIQTERLILREWKLTDIDDLVGGLNNYETAKNLTTPYPYTKKDAIDFLQKHLKNDEKNYYFAIVLKENKKVIGGTSLEMRKDPKIGNGGIWLNQAYVGKGYGTEVWRARAKFAFESLGLDALENGYYDFNKKSAHMQKKVGYKIVGEKTNFCPALKREVKEVLTRLTREDYLKLN